MGGGAAGRLYAEGLGRVAGGDRLQHRVPGQRRPLPEGCGAGSCPRFQGHPGPVPLRAFRPRGPWLWPRSSSNKPLGPSSDRTGCCEPCGGFAGLPRGRCAVSCLLPPCQRPGQRGRGRAPLKGSCASWFFSHVFSLKPRGQGSRRVLLTRQISADGARGASRWGDRCIERSLHAVEELRGDATHEGL